MDERICISFLRQSTIVDIVPTWLSDEQVTHHLCRGSIPSNKESDKSIFREVEFEFSDPLDFSIIGYGGIHEINWISRSGELRILIGSKAHWNRGFGKAGINKMLEYSFSILNLNRVWLGVNSENSRAVGLYLSTGFREEGVLRQEFYKHGRYIDIIRMSILRTEWVESMKDLATRNNCNV